MENKLRLIKKLYKKDPEVIDRLINAYLDGTFILFMKSKETGELKYEVYHTTNHAFKIGEFKQLCSMILANTYDPFKS